MSTTASTTSARTPTTCADHRYGDPSTRWALLGAETMLSREPRINTRQRWEYEDGLVLNGIYGMYCDTRDARLLDYVRTNIDEFVQPDGTIRHYAYEELNLDHVNNGKAILDLLEETGDERYRAAADTLFDQLQHQPRTNEGSFWHKRIYPDQVWLDGLYMGSVFYARYCALAGRSDLLDDVVRQFTNAYDLTLDPATGLCRHAYDATRSMYWADAETGLSPHVWLRALGWFAMAMVDVQAYLPQDHPGRAQIRTNLTALLTALQRSRGSGHQPLVPAPGPGRTTHELPRVLGVPHGALGDRDLVAPGLPRRSPVGRGAGTRLDPRARAVPQHHRGGLGERAQDVPGRRARRRHAPRRLLRVLHVRADRHERPQGLWSVLLLATEMERRR